MPAHPPHISSLNSLLDAHRARTGVSESELARRIGVTRQNLGLWRRDGLRRLPQREHLESVASLDDRLTYEAVLEATLLETGYLAPSEALIIPRRLVARLLEGVAENAGRRAQLRARRSVSAGMIDDSTAPILAWLWRSARPDVACAFLSTYRHALNDNPDDSPHHMDFTLDEVLDGAREALSGSLLSDSEFDAFAAAARQQSTPL